LLVDYVPGFLLRTSFIRKLVAKIRDAPYEYLKQELTCTSETYPAMVHVLKSQETAKTRASEQTLKNVAATIHISAIDNVGPYHSICCLMKTYDTRLLLRYRRSY
jgi:hypothetical protein